MDTQTETSSESKQITIDVPQERLAEFYAFFGRFLAGGPGRGRRGRHAGGPGHHHAHHHGHHHGRHCDHQQAAETAGAESQAAGPPAGTTSV
ncbi:MAG: hypothetical protein QOF77_1070 [Solirubrobacteraceae bacterium]|jgi:hypothetical protein|nr:hypothetical protein [Solirubrobacteraceae bacterium]